MKVGETWQYKAHGCLVKIVRIWIDKEEEEEDGDGMMIEIKSLGCEVDNVDENTERFGEYGLDMDPDEFPYYFREEFLKEFRRVYDEGK
jgi:hypothetical protein